MVRACTPTCRSGRTASRCSRGNEYAGLSEACLYYIGGVIKHAKALNAFTNPTTNSYKKAGSGLRSAGAACLFGAQPLGFVPSFPTARATRPSGWNFRFPDAMANPYLAYSALLMAGLDGIGEQDPPGRGDGQEPV